MSQRVNQWRKKWQHHADLQPCLLYRLPFEVSTDGTATQEGHLTLWGEWSQTCKSSRKLKYFSAPLQEQQASCSVSTVLGISLLAFTLLIPILWKGWFLLVYVEDGGCGVHTPTPHTHRFGSISLSPTCMWPPNSSSFLVSSLQLPRKRPHPQPVLLCFPFPPAGGAVSFLQDGPTPVSSCL